MRFLGHAPTIDLTYSDVFLAPGRSGVTSRLEVDLTPDDATPATLPLVAANMNSVTGPRLAGALARRGGLAVLPQDLAMPAMLAAIAEVKAQPVTSDAPVRVASDMTVAEARSVLPPVPGHALVVSTDASARADDLVGIVPATRLSSALSDALLGDLIHEAPVLLDEHEVLDPRVAFDRLHALGTEVVGVVRDGELVGTLSERSALRRNLYRPALDAGGRLSVAAAVGINGDPAGRARELVAAGVDVLVIDTAHGHQEGMIRAVRAVRELDLGVPIAAGNVVTASGVADLVDAGASILKVGVGPGAMCTTRMMTAVGRPQFSAVLEASAAAAERGAHVWADGGVRYPRDVALALAAGASSVMIGSWFAGTVEAPGRVLNDGGGAVYKESWGMASTKAVQGRFQALDPYERARKELFAEGISSSKILIDPLRPSVEDLIDMITSGVRSSFTYAGARSLPEFRERAVVGLQSAAGYEEGKALPVSW